MHHTSCLGLGFCSLNSSGFSMDKAFLSTMSKLDSRASNIDATGRRMAPHTSSKRPPTPEAGRRPTQSRYSADALTRCGFFFQIKKGFTEGLNPKGSKLLNRFRCRAPSLSMGRP
ncbi:hypothetical protein DQ04_04771020 [Trypanosoma grayi]|uniref:hypothetical protein n=1 Tax=Trypanosoma grayi TaxID=71804 RepID=UPI0004F467BB|nr:hypothetical protein DQ04_04771020 [Trypanosoma grayi]KEG09719.1 hypothetical protein DQ04_04771020 [Trypanosoma grayi]